MSKPAVKLEAVGPDGKKWMVHVCPKCRRTALNLDMAETCCDPAICACGDLCSAPWTTCDRCQAKKRMDREREKIAKSKKISWRDFDGPVFDGDEYFENIDAFFEHLHDDTIDPPDYVTPCNVVGLTLDAEQIIESAIDQQEHHEDARDEITNVAELQLLIDGWCKEQSMRSWSPMDGVIIDLSDYDPETNK